MDISRFIDSGWFGFTVVIFAGAALIPSLVLGHGHREGRTRPFGRAFGFFWVFLFWYIFREFLPIRLINRVPIGLFAPGIDLALALAVVWFTIREVSSVFTPEWTWRSGARAVGYFLPLVVVAWPIHTDFTAMPTKGWVLWGIQAFILLPFLLRLAYFLEKESAKPNTEHQTPDTKGDRS